MLNNYYLLRWISHVWNQSLQGAAVVDGWCHVPGELTLALEQDAEMTAISFLTQAPVIGVFRRKDVGHPRRNAKSLFRRLRRQFITEVSISESDRILILKFTGGFHLQGHLYGSRPNIVLADEAGRVQEAFRKGAPEVLPQPRIAPEPQNLVEFITRWQRLKGDSANILRRIYARFNRDQAREAISMSGPSHGSDLSLIYEAAQALHLQLMNTWSALYIYRNPHAVSLIPLSTRKEDEIGVYHDVDEGIRVYAQRLLSERAYRMQYEPLRKNLVRMLDKAERSVERMKQEQSRPSRADDYERIGHLLMALPPLPAGESQIELHDIFHQETTVTVALDPSLNSLQNAERYYVKARKARTSRSHLNALIHQAEAKVDSLKTELESLGNAKTHKELKVFQKTREKIRTSGQPFRRYSLGPGYELWVGRNAKESEMLTLRQARPFDLWFHAHGVSGAHAVLRLPGRDSQPGSYLIEKAAAIAAWHSKARTSSLAPVIVTPRKYVRKARGAPLGEVSVSQEEIIMVEPALP